MSGLSAAKKRFVLSEETDLEATTEESIEECASSSDLEKGKKEEALCNDGKVKNKDDLKGPYTNSTSSVHSSRRILT